MKPETAFTQFCAGKDTLAIAAMFAVTEAEAYNALAQRVPLRIRIAAAAEREWKRQEEIDRAFERSIEGKP